MSKAASFLKCAAGLAVFMATRSIGTAGSGVPGRPITVGVLNYAKVSPGILVEAEKQARAVFHEAGVETKWIDCPLAGSRVDPGSCSDPPDFFLMILAKVMPDLPPSERYALGFAFPCHRLAYMFYSRIEAMAADGDVTPSLVLGHVIAHEIGHLSLGPGHSPSGIMRTDWNRRDLQLASRQQLLFLPAQAKSLRAAISKANLAAVEPASDRNRTEMKSGNCSGARIRIPPTGSCEPHGSARI